MSIEKYPALILEYKYFDLLTNPVEIALYTLIERNSPNSQLIDMPLIYQSLDKMGLNGEIVDEACQTLIKIGYLHYNKGN